MELALVLLACLLAFTLSASAGMGGSLILVPALAALLGAKEGIVLAALLLGANNVAKVWAYRATVPWREVTTVLILTVCGAYFGGRWMAAAPAGVVGAAVVAALVLTFWLERWGAGRRRATWAPLLGLGAGLSSGFSGTSGPLKGVALRSLALDRRSLVGAASIVSLAGDAAKASAYGHAGMIAPQALTTVLTAVPVMVVATQLGKRLNRDLGERGFSALFWAVMTGYSVRLLVM